MDNVFEQKNTFRVYLQMAVPLVLSMMVSMVYNIADTYFISYTQDALLVAGVSLCFPINTIMMALGNLLSQGGSSILSRSLGKNDVETVKKVSSFCFYISIILGVLLGIVFLLGRTPMLYLMGADADTLFSAKPYYTIMAMGAPFVVLSYIPTNMMRSEGRAKEMMVASILGTIINLILDPLFIIALGMGARGAALATVAGYVGTDIYCLYIILKKGRHFSIRPGYFQCGTDIIKEVFAIGASSAVMNILMAISQMMSNKALLSYGSDKIAAMSIAAKIFYVAFMVMVGLSFGAQPVIGYFYGKGNKEKLYEIVKQIFVFMIVLSLIFTVVLIATASLTIPCFLKDETIVAAGKQMLFWQSITLVGAAIVTICNVLFQSMGKAKIAFLMSLTRQGILFMVILQVCKTLFGYMGVITSQTIANVLSALIAIAFLFYVKDEVRPSGRQSGKIEEQD